MDDPDQSSDSAGSVRPVTCIDTFDVTAIERALADGDFLWLNLRDHPGEEASAARAGRLLGLHPLTVEDLEHFGQRAKVERYDDYAHIVVYGAAPDGDDDSLVEVHVVSARDFMLTVSHDESPELQDLHGRASENPQSGRRLLHAVLDLLIDSFAPLLDDFDRQIEVIEGRIFERELRDREVEIHNVRRRLANVSRATHRMSESFTRLHEVLSVTPGHDPGLVPYFRDIQDHLHRVVEAADSMRDRVQGAFEIYLAALDNRQNMIMKQFTVIAGIFLPLTVLVGFFGQNFEWMVAHINSGPAFAVFGLALPFVVIAALLTIVWRRGFFAD